MQANRSSFFLFPVSSCSFLLSVGVTRRHRQGCQLIQLSPKFPSPPLTHDTQSQEERNSCFVCCPFPILCCRSGAGAVAGAGAGAGSSYRKREKRRPCAYQVLPPFLRKKIKKAGIEESKNVILVSSLVRLYVN